MSKEVQPQVAAPGTGYLAGYLLVSTPADIAALTPCTMLDFKAGLKYTYFVKVGQVSLGGTPPVYEDRSEAKTTVVRDWNLSLDLFDFQRRVMQGNAYTPVQGQPIPPAPLSFLSGEEKSDKVIGEILNVIFTSRKKALEETLITSATSNFSPKGYVFDEDGQKEPLLEGLSEGEQKKILADQKEKDLKAAEPPKKNGNGKK